MEQLNGRGKQLFLRHRGLHLSGNERLGSTKSETQEPKAKALSDLFLDPQLFFEPIAGIVQHTSNLSQSCLH